MITRRELLKRTPAVATGLVCSGAVLVGAYDEMEKETQRQGRLVQLITQLISVNATSETIERFFAQYDKIQSSVASPYSPSAEEVVNMRSNVFSNRAERALSPLEALIVLRRDTASVKAMAHVLMTHGAVPSDDGRTEVLLLRRIDSATPAEKQELMMLQEELKNVRLQHKHIGRQR